MRTELSDWLNRVETEPGHEYLYGGFKALTSKFPRSCVTDEEVVGGFAAIARVLGTELSHALHSLDRCQPVINKWSRGRFDKSSDEWGQYLLAHGRLGAFEVTEQEVERHPRCSCGGPHYRFTLKLRSTWYQYTRRCIQALQDLVDSWYAAGLSVPIMDEVAANDWLSAFTIQDKHIGRGAFIAQLETELDEVALARTLSHTGFKLPESEIRLLDLFGSASSYPPESSIFAHPDDAVFNFLLTGMAKAKSQHGRRILELFAEDDEPAVRRISRELLSKQDHTP